MKRRLHWKSLLNTFAVKLGTEVFPAGVDGVLYPPKSLPTIGTDAKLLRQLGATCDDSWLYVMWRQTLGWSCE
jgi:hypothetical protein